MCFEFQIEKFREVDTLISDNLNKHFSFSCNGLVYAVLFWPMSKTLMIFNIRDFKN